MESFGVTDFFNPLFGITLLESMFHVRRNQVVDLHKQKQNYHRVRF